MRALRKKLRRWTKAGLIRQLDRSGVRGIHTEHATSHGEKYDELAAAALARRT